MFYPDSALYQKHGRFPALCRNNRGRARLLGRVNHIPASFSIFRNNKMLHAGTQLENCWGESTIFQNSSIGTHLHALIPSLTSQNKEKVQETLIKVFPRWPWWFERLSASTGQTHPCHCPPHLALGEQYCYCNHTICTDAVTEEH